MYLVFKNHPYPCGCGCETHFAVTFEASVPTLEEAIEIGLGFGLTYTIEYHKTPSGRKSKKYFRLPQAGIFKSSDKGLKYVCGNGVFQNVGFADYVPLGNEENEE